MRKKILHLCLVGGLFAVAHLAASPIQTTFTGVEGTNAFGYYVGPYYGQLESKNVSLFCDDFANEVNFGQQWTANLSSITTGSDLSQTRYGDLPNAGILYQEIAWLDTQFGQQPNTQWGDIHATIWQIFDAAQAPTPSSGYWLNQAQQNFSSLNYDSFRVVTNVGPVLKTGQVQEFITVLPASMVTVSAPGTTPTPEPMTVMMVGSAILFAIFGLRFARGRKNALSIRASPQ